ncbi:MAG: tRNA uridine-5-carboxymethylaminomethyl(34) synthesis GTPase MnmE [Acidobacteriota bacterium]|nr:tRNA uridine-5-carboxymethylaminomethyl(34) synthesis GTPase MnmE [Acidobacteriota bacterium]
MNEDTIVAISTPPGRGGIGIVRVSGAGARAVVEPMVRLRGPMEAGRARFAEVIELGGVSGQEDEAIPGSFASLSMRADSGETANDGEQHGRPEGRVLDEAVVTFWARPNSYTGEDVVELALHGSPVLLEQVVRQCCAGGARLARPGEFTERAFVSGRIDLTQAEAVDDLIASSTLEQARLAARQMGGELAKAVAPAKERLVSLVAALEAGIDFAEDDIDVMPVGAIAAAIREVLQPLDLLLASFARGRIVREGLRLAIVGRPNAGKSSLFNRLVERERAIVTALPGTTRDTVSERVSLGGIPLELVDTAGLREAEDEAERMGIARSRQAMADADVVLVVVDAAAGWPEQEAGLLGELAGRPVVVAWNKWDLITGDLIAGDVVAEEVSAGLPHGVAGVRTSAVTGDGIAELRAAIAAVVGAGGAAEGGVLTNLRQHAAVEQAVLGLGSALAAVEAGIPHEVVLVDLYDALRGLDALTGATTTEDVLRLVFSRFCIGK